MVAPAVIIPWRDIGDGGESLRFALRSVDAHLPHSEVIVAGDRVGWAIGVLNLVRPRSTAPLVDSRTSMLAGARIATPDWAYLMDDDVFIMRPVDYIAPAHRGPLQVNRGRSSYYAAGYRTVSWLSDHGITRPFNYSTHLPMLVNVARFISITERAAADIGGGFWVRAAYANMAGVRGPQIIDPKQVGMRPNPAHPVWSATDGNFARGMLGKELRRRFPGSGRYEKVSWAA